LQTRQVVVLVVVVAIIALALGATIGYGISSGKTTTTSVTTQTVATTTTSLTSQTIMNPSSNSTGELYELRFNQTSPCSPPIYLIPWSVTLSNGMMIAEPPHDNFSECCAGSSDYTNYSSIVFSVLNGNYIFSTNGPSFFTESGNVTVNGKDVIVLLQEEIASCGSRSSSGLTSTTLTPVNSNNSLWSFSLVVTYAGSGNEVSGGTIHLNANLTYLGSQNVSINYVDPLLAGISVQSLANSSRYVWAYQPPAVTFFNYTVTHGMSFLDSVDIPTNTSGFITGQGYSISFSPIVNYTKTSESVGDLQVQWNFTLL